LTVDGISKELSFKRTWEKTKWKANPGRATGKGEPVKALNVNGKWKILNVEITNPIFEREQLGEGQVSRIENRVKTEIFYKAKLYAKKNHIFDSSDHRQ
jgi:hypothetical protein